MSWPQALDPGKSAAGAGVRPARDRMARRLLKASTKPLGVLFFWRFSMSKLMGWSVVAVGVSVVAGCTGLAFPSTPGGDGPSSSLSTGGIAVDPRTETAFVLKRSTSDLAGTDGGIPGSGIPGGPIFAIGPDTGAVTQVADLTGYGEIRVLFPKSSMLVLGEDGTTNGDTLMRFDENTLAMTTSVSTTAQYWGTRTSPTGTYVAVADNSQASPPIHVIEADTLKVHALPANGAELEAMWLRKSDTLVAIYFTSGPDSLGSARIITWSVPQLQGLGFPTDQEGLWTSRQIDVTVPNVGFDDLFSYTWVGISPDDTTAAIPVLTQTAAGAPVTHELIVMDLAKGAFQTVANAYGPVGFTPDGSTIVSYRYSANASDSSQLLLIDTKTLAPETADIPSGAAPTFYVTSEGNDVVIASDLGLTTLVVYDVSTHSFEKVGGPALALSSFVARVGHDELWLVDDGLFRLDFVTAALTQIPISWTPLNIDILPMHDLLVLDDQASGDIRFFSPDTLAVTQTVALPVAVATTASMP